MSEAPEANPVRKMSEGERMDSFELGVQVAMLQARGWRELNEELKEEKGIREVAVERCNATIVAVKGDLETRLVEVFAKLTILENTLQVEMNARQALEVVASKQGVELQQAQQKLVEEQSRRQALEERVQLEIDARVALEERVGSMNSRLSDCEAQVSNLNNVTNRLDLALQARDTNEQIQRRVDKMALQVQAFARDEDMKLESLLEVHSRHMKQQDAAQDSFEKELQSQRAERNGLDHKINEGLATTDKSIDALREEIGEKMKQAEAEELLRAGRYDEKLIKADAARMEMDKAIENDRAFSKELSTRLTGTNEELAAAKLKWEKDSENLDILQHRVQRNVNMLQEMSKGAEVHERRIGTLEEQGEEANVRHETVQRRLMEEAAARERLLLKVNADSSTLALLKEEMKYVKQQG